MRYDLDFKMQVIAYYRQGHSSHAIAKKFNVNPEFVLKWVKQYQSGGIMTPAVKSVQLNLGDLITQLDDNNQTTPVLAIYSPSSFES